MLRDRLRPSALLARFKGSRAARGSFWTIAGFGATYAIRLLSTLVLTRLLAPDAFGLMSLAGVFLTGISMLSDLGTSVSVIRSPRGDDPAYLRTAWSLQVIRGFGIAGVTCLIAWPVAMIYEQPVLFAVLCALALSPAIDGLRTISAATVQRHQDLKRVTLIDISYQLSSTLISVLAAWWLQSVWALVIGSNLASLARLLVGYRVLPKFRHRFELEAAAMKDMVRFGRWILLGTLLTYLGGQGNRAIFALMIPLDALGLLTIAQTLSWSLGQLIGKLLNQVALPAMSRVMRERPQDLPATATRIKRMMFFYVTPCFIALSLFSQPLVDLLYDPRYAEVGTFVGMLALSGAVSTLAMPYQNAMLASGNSRGHALVMGMGTVFRIALPVAMILAFGIYGIFLGLFLGNLMNYGISYHFARKNDYGTIFYDAISIAVLSGLFVWKWGEALQSGAMAAG